MIKVMTYNTRCTNGMDLSLKKGDWLRTGKVIAAANADIIGLEEVAINHPYAKGVNVPAELSAFLKMNYFFGVTISYPRWDEGQYEFGVAAFARHKLTLVQEVSLPVPEKREKRMALIVKVAASRPYYFIVTHLSYEGEFPDDEKHRVEAIRLITETVKNNAYTPAILVGDFNANPDSPCLAAVRQEWTVCNDRNPELSFPADQPQRLIDYICFYPKQAFEINECHVVPDSNASDHRPVVAELKMN